VTTQKDFLLGINHHKKFYIKEFNTSLDYFIADFEMKNILIKIY